MQVKVMYRVEHLLARLTILNYLIIPNLFLLSYIL
jgi:hypothetical protein